METKYVKLHQNVWDCINKFEEQIKTDLAVKIITTNPDFVIDKSEYQFVLINPKTGVRISYRFPDTQVSKELYVAIYGLPDPIISTGFTWKFLISDLDTVFNKYLNKYVKP